MSVCVPHQLARLVLCVGTEINGDGRAVCVGGWLGESPAGLRGVDLRIK